MPPHQMKQMAESLPGEAEQIDRRYARAQSTQLNRDAVSSVTVSSQAVPGNQTAKIHQIHPAQPAHYQNPQGPRTRQAHGPVIAVMPSASPHAPRVRLAPQSAQPIPRTTKPSVKSTDRQESVLTGALLIGFVVLGLLVVASIMGLFLLSGESNNANVTTTKATSQVQDNVLSSGLLSREQNLSQRNVQKIITLEEQNRRMQLELVMLRQKNADMTSALAEIRSLYSAVRIDNSWTLAKADLAGASSLLFDRSIHDPILYSDFPVLSEQETQSASQLPRLDQSVDNSLAFKNDLPTVGASPIKKADAKTPVASKPDQATTPVRSGNTVMAALTSIATPQLAMTDESSARILRMPLSKPAALVKLQSSQSQMKLASIEPLAGFEPDQTPQTPARPLTGNTARFLSKMQALRAGSLNEAITILHIGDSHIASDSFTRGIRRRLQSIYGDAGRGAVIPAKAYKYAHADGVSLTASRGWSAANSLRVKNGPYGVSGVRVSSSSKGAKMTLTSKSGMFDWAEVTLYVGPKQGSVTIATQAGSKKVSARASKAGSKTVRIEGRSKTLTVTHAGGGKTTVLNWASGKNKPGIQYVNFGLSGATAAVTKRWSDTLLANDIKRIDPDLIIYGYGTNEGYNDNLNVASYRKMAASFVGKMRQAAPAAAMMFIGPADGARRRSSSISCGGGWYTPKKLGAVRGTLQAMAKDNSGLFWDWASAMGGRCGAAKWSTQSPRLAAKDRVHLTPKGYDKSAGAFVGFLEKQVKNSLKIAAN